MATESVDQERLDALFCDFFEKFEELRALKEECNTLLRSGFFNLGRARYNQGGKTITRLQYNLNMQALLR